MRKELKITKSQIRNMYETMTVRSICKELDICSTVFYKIIDDLEIKRKKDRYKLGKNQKITIIDDEKEK